MRVYCKMTNALAENFNKLRVIAQIAKTVANFPIASTWIELLTTFLTFGPIYNDQYAEVAFKILFS